MSEPSLSIHLDLLGAIRVVLPSGVAVRLREDTGMAQIRELLMAQAKAKASGSPMTVATKASPTQLDLDRVTKYTPRGVRVIELADIGL